MIRIVKKGKISKKPDHYYIAKCEKCGCKFEYERTYINEIISNFYGSDEHIINCPTCKRKLKKIKYDNYDRSFDRSFTWIFILLLLY